MSVHDRWKRTKAAERNGRRWEVRWRESGRQCKRRFETRQAAEHFEAERRIEPEMRQTNAGRSLTVDAMMETWLATKGGLRPKTREAYATDKREVLLTFSGRLAASLVPSEIRVWSARDRGVSLRKRSLLALGQAYRLAIADGLLKSTPALGVPLPKDPRPERRYLTEDQLRALAGALDGDDKLIILTLGLMGLRIGELAGLRVADVDVQRRRLTVRRQITIVGNHPTEGPPKTGHAREVPIPLALLVQLPLAGRDVEEWLFPGLRHTGNWRRNVFQPACAAARLGKITVVKDETAGTTRTSYEGLTPHELRHTAASLSIHGGVDVLTVQRMLGHAKPSITVDLYSHLSDAGLDHAAAVMEERLKGAFRALELPKPSQVDPTNAPSGQPFERVETG